MNNARLPKFPHFFPLWKTILGGKYKSMESFCGRGSTVLILAYEGSSKSDIVFVSLEPNTWKGDIDNGKISLLGLPGSSRSKNLYHPPLPT